MVMSWVMLSRTCTRISVGYRFLGRFQPLLGLWAHLVRGPGRLPDNLDFCLFHARDLLDLCLDLVHQVGMCGASDCGQGHADFDAVIIDCDSVNETEVYDVHRYLGIIAVAECVHNSVHCERFGHEGLPWI